MSHYTAETQKILDNFLNSMDENPEADQAFVAYLTKLIKEGKFTYRMDIKKAVSILEEAVPDES